jgi:hypothetical protein
LLTKSGFDGVLKHVPYHSSKLSVISDNVVVALVLPKSPLPAEELVALSAVYHFNDSIIRVSL